MKILLSEIITKAGEADTLEEQALVLGQNNTLALRQILKAALDPAVKFDVEIPQYTPSPDAPGCSSNNLFIESRRLYVLLANCKSTTPLRRKQLLANMLESIDEADAELLVHVVRKDLSAYRISPEAVKLAFPGLLP